jgi:hypothetical protein
MRLDRIAFYIMVIFATACESDSSTSMQSVGQGGSTSRYTIQNNYLYVVDDVSLRVYNLADNKFTQVNVQEVGFGIETIFSRPDYLYLGANNGMYIYDISNAESPVFVFRYEHILSCDPVVVQGNRAYVTLSASAEVCNRGVNALEIIDITDRYNPTLVTSYAMQSPRGLGVDGTYLFISEGEFGLKVLDITDERNAEIIQTIPDIHAFDVIARANRLTVTGQDGIFQYSYPTDGPNFLELLSKIPVNRQ